MDDVFSCGETAWDLIHDRSYFLLRKKYTPFLKGNPAQQCSVFFFVCGISSTGCWFAFISSLLFYQYVPNIHFLYYLSAYTLGSLPVLALHKNYEQNISKRDFPRWTFMTRMTLCSVYGIVISIVLSYYNFALLVNLFCILGLGVSHGALLGGLSQLASVFPSTCGGALLLGVDVAGVLPFLMIIIVTLGGSSPFFEHVLFIVPAVVSVVGVVSLFLLIRSEMANQYLGQCNTILRNNIEGLETLLSRSGDEPVNENQSSGQYVSLSSFLSVYPTSYKEALTWGVLVFACTFCTYFMVPFFPEAKKTHIHFPVFLFFTQHFADIVGRELLCGIVKNAVKGKLFMWMLVLLRALIIMGWLAEVLVSRLSDVLIGIIEVGAVLLCGLVGGSINPSLYMLAGLRISDDTRDSVKAMHCCMWCSVAGSVTALALLNVVSFVHPSLAWG